MTTHTWRRDGPHPVAWAAAGYGLLIFLTLPAGVAVLNDNFGYLRSIVETLQHGRPWTNDWLEPWAASLSVFSALVFKLTGSFVVATQGLQAVYAAATVAGAAAVLRQRGVGAGASAVGGWLLASFPTAMWKFVEFTGVALSLPCLFWAIWAAGRRSWGLFFVVWLVAFSSRQSAAAWLVLPAWAAVADWARGNTWRAPAAVLAGGGISYGTLALAMNRTQAQAMLTERWLERVAAANVIPVVTMGLAVGLVALGLGRLALALNQPTGSVGGSVAPRRILGGLILTVVVLVVLPGGGRMFVEHASFEGRAGLLYLGGLGALAVAGWIIAAAPFRGEFLLAGAASLALVVRRPEVWDYYYADLAVLAFFAVGELPSASVGPGESQAGAGASWARTMALAGAVVFGGYQLYLVWVTKCRVDRDAAACRLAETSLREGKIDVTELSGLPMSFVGWHLHPYFTTHDGRGRADIGGFLRYVRDGALEVRRSPRRFWSDSQSLYPLRGADAARVVASRVSRVGWFWFERCSLLRAAGNPAEPRLVLDRTQFRAEFFPLTDREWRAWVDGQIAAKAAEAQIRARIESIRAAIVAKSAEGIVRWGTPDWRFTGPDGKAFDRAGYLQRTAALFARIEEIESLATVVDRIAVAGDTATIEITQTMIRRERVADAGAAAGLAGAATRLRLRYRERQEWIRSASDGWRVRRVEFVGSPQREVLPGAPR